VETVVGPNAATVYGALCLPKAIGPMFQVTSRNIAISAIKSNAMVTDLIIELYGALTATGTKTLLKTNVITGLTNAQKTGIVDLNAYPFPFYFVGVTSASNNSNGDVTFHVFA
jgi:hypothetical protein